MLQPESLYRLRFPSDPRVSPDGRQVAFVLTRVEEEHPEKPEPDFAKPRYKSRIWLADKHGSRELTGGAGRDWSPRWSPDGRTLALLSDRAGGKPQLFLLPVTGGEARQVTHFKGGVSDPTWSPDGTLIAFTSPRDREDKRVERGQPFVTEDLQYKANGAGFLPAQPDDLYLLDVRTGEVRLWLTPPTRLADFAWWPDGGRALFIAAPDRDRAAQWETEVYELTLDGASRQLTNWRASLGNLAPHPDGQRFAVTGHPADKRNTEDDHVFLFEDGGARWRRLDEGWDYPAGNIVAGDCHVGAMPGRPTWLEGGKRLALPYTVGGSCGIFELGHKKGKVHERHFTRGEVISAFTANDQGEAFIRETERAYPEVYLNGERVTDLAAQLDFTPLAATTVTVDGQGGTVEGWLLRPEQAPEGGKLPLLVNIHGGPHTAYGYGFQHEFQLFAAQGYAVAYSNPRGSVGYGQAWSEAIFGVWGTVDYDDIMAFTDAVLSSDPELDARRSAVMGGSYGGFMTNWVVGHTDRFACAVTDRSICNLISFGGTSDIGMRFWDDELGGNFQRSADITKLWDMSPLQYVERVKTPTLVIHSEEDYRCPVEQAEQWFAALKLHGVPTRLVRFPGENHELSRSGRPDRRVTRLHEYLNWLSRFLTPAEPTAPVKAKVHRQTPAKQRASGGARGTKRSAGD